MELQIKLKRLLPFIGLTFLLILYVFHLKTIILPSGLIADEFIYLSHNHLKLGFLDYIFYSPANFFGHSPLLPGLNRLIFSLSGNNLIAVRVFHLSLPILLPILLYLYDRRWTWLKVWLTGLWLFHPFVLAQGITLYPETLQVLLCGLCFLSWDKEKSYLLAIFLTLAILLRETSLIFLATLFFLNHKKRKISPKIFLLPFTIFLLHMGLVIYNNAWNPGWMGYESAGFLEESKRFLFTINWMFSAPFGVAFITGVLLYPMFQVLIGKQRQGQFPSFFSFQNLFLLTLFILIGFLIFFEIKDSTPFNPWKWFHRVGSLGKLGLILLPLIGIGIIPTERKPPLLYFWSCAISYLLFFFWYQAHSSRDLLPLYGFTVLALGFQRNTSLKNLRLSVALIVISLHIYSFTGFIGRPFLKNPLSLYSPQQIRETYEKEGQFLERVKRIRTTISLENDFLNYLGNPNLNETPLVFQPEGELFLSLNGNLQEHKIIDKGVALYLYRRLPSAQRSE